MHRVKREMKKRKEAKEILCVQEAILNVCGPGRRRVLYKERRDDKFVD